MMILTEYLIDVLSKLSCLVGCIAILTGMAALFSALGESITSKPNMADLVFFVSVAFVSMITFVVIPSREIIRCFVAG